MISAKIDPAEIHGHVWEDGPAIETTDGELPDNYRELRDGILQAGIDTPLEGVRMYLYYYIDPTTEGIDPRPVTLGEVMAEDYAHLGTTDPEAAVWVDTMADGGYWFTGLQAGNYIVLRNSARRLLRLQRYAGYDDWIHLQLGRGNGRRLPPRSFESFPVSQLMDSVVNIRVNAGWHFGSEQLQRSSPDGNRSSRESVATSTADQSTNTDDHRAIQSLRDPGLPACLDCTVPSQVRLRNSLEIHAELRSKRRPLPVIPTPGT